MPNAIKYSASAQTLALKKGNFWIGTGDVGKGPTSTTDYWNGISPPSGGYTIYLNKASNGPAIYTAANDSQLISLTNGLAGQTFATAAAALDWYNGQTDKMVFNIDYESIVTNGLVLNLDAGFTPSYPTTGTTWYDVSSGGNDGTLINGPAYSSSNGGSIVFDGVDDYSTASNYTQSSNSQLTLDVWVKPTGSPSTDKTTILSKWGSASLGNFSWLLFINWFSSNTLYFLVGNSSGNNYSTASMTHGLSTTTYANLTVTYNSGAIKMYKNGSLLITTTSPYTSLKTVPTPLTIGNDWDGGTPYGSPTRPDTLESRYWKGNIPDIKIYNVALSDNEVLQNYNAQKSRFGL